MIRSSAHSITHDVVCTRMVASKYVLASALLYVRHLWRSQPKNNVRWSSTAWNSAIGQWSSSHSFPSFTGTGTGSIAPSFARDFVPHNRIARFVHAFHYAYSFAHSLSSSWESVRQLMVHFSAFLHHSALGYIFLHHISHISFMIFGEEISPSPRRETSSYLETWEIRLWFGLFLG